MKKQLFERLQRLRHEYESGERMLADLEESRAGLSRTLLRIGGAIQVLEEELARCEEAGAGAQIVEIARENEPRRPDPRQTAPGIRP